MYSGQSLACMRGRGVACDADFLDQGFYLFPPPTSPSALTQPKPNPLPKCAGGVEGENSPDRVLSPRRPTSKESDPLSPMREKGLSPRKQQKDTLARIGGGHNLRKQVREGTLSFPIKITGSWMCAPYGPCFLPFTDFLMTGQGCAGRQSLSPSQIIRIVLIQLQETPLKTAESSIQKLSKPTIITCTNATVMINIPWPCSSTVHAGCHTGHLGNVLERGTADHHPRSPGASRLPRRREACPWGWGGGLRRLVPASKGAGPLCLLGRGPRARLPSQPGSRQVGSRSALAHT